MEYAVYLYANFSNRRVDGNTGNIVVIHFVPQSCNNRPTPVLSFPYSENKFLYYDGTTMAQQGFEELISQAKELECQIDYYSKD